MDIFLIVLVKYINNVIQHVGHVLILGLKKRIYAQVVIQIMVFGLFMMIIVKLSIVTQIVLLIIISMTKMNMSV